MSIVGGLLQDLSSQIGSTVHGLRRPSSHTEQALIDFMELFIMSKSKDGKAPDMDRGFVLPENDGVFKESHVDILRRVASGGDSEEGTA